MEIEKAKILLVEDDLNLGQVLKNYLEVHDYIVELCRDGLLGLEAFKKDKFDICLLDVMMPNMDGFTLAEEIRSIDPDVPLFFLSARNMKEDLIAGYNLGADDYITKPFDSEVLLHKIKVVLKRNQDVSDKGSSQYSFEFGKFKFNSKLRILEVDEEEHTLSPKESELLQMLCEYKNDLLPREKALKRIWGSDTYFNGRSMDVYIAKLRKYLSVDESVSIVNIHGNGFRLLIQDGKS